MPLASGELLRQSPGSGKAGGAGAEKGWLEKLAQETAFAGAIANGQMNEDTRGPDGQPYGIPTGKNAGVTSFDWLPVRLEDDGV